VIAIFILPLTSDITTLDFTIGFNPHIRALLCSNFTILFYAGRLCYNIFLTLLNISTLLSIPRRQSVARRLPHHLCRAQQYHKSASNISFYNPPAKIRSAFTKYLPLAQEYQKAVTTN
jgi:hypothetical protein